MKNSINHPWNDRFCKILLNWPAQGKIRMKMKQLGCSSTGNPQLLIRALNSVNQHTSHSGSGSSSRRARSEKKPIPAEKKDNKYFERRKRNNYAAKKSRDYRKQREDEIAMRANQLEKDNANLKAQLAMLREEAASLQGMLMQKQMARQQSAHDQLSTRFSSFVTHGGHISV